MFRSNNLLKVSKIIHSNQIFQNLKNVIVKFKKKSIDTAHSLTKC